MAPSLAPGLGHRSSSISMTFAPKNFKTLLFSSGTLFETVTDNFKFY